MRKNTLTYLRSLSNKNGISYNKIVKELCQQISEFETRTTGSIYLKKYIANDEYISCRVANHFPKLKNYMKINPGRMSTNQNAHICALFFGRYEADHLDKSLKNQYVFSESDRKYTINVDDKAFAYYNSNTDINIPYKLYHFIPDLMSENDISLLSESIKTWYDLNGNEPFIIPNALSQNVWYKEKSEKGISSIDCNMRIIKTVTNESINVGMIAGVNPVMTIDIGKVTIVSSKGEKLTLQGYIDVMKCNSRELSLLQEIVDFDFDTGMYSSVSHSESSDIRSSEEKKRFDEQLKTVKEKHPELYESMMVEIEAILRKYLR